MRHPERNVKIEVAKILTNVNKFQKLPSEFQLKFRWILMQMVHLMPSSEKEEKTISEICEIIASIATEAKEPRHMQKIAGDIEAIEKLCDILLNLKLSQEDEDMLTESQ